MIFITQGHEHSISIEIFIKTFLSLCERYQSLLTYIASQESVSKYLNIKKIKHKFENDYLFIGSSKLKFKNIDQSSYQTQSSASIEIACSLCESTDSSFLITMPTSKDQIFYKNTICRGHTEYFRHRYKNKNIGMCFHYKETNLLLLTDHIPISKIYENISAESVEKKVSLAIKLFCDHKIDINKVLFSGINPHCGEGGLIGHEDEKISQALVKLKNKFKKIQFLGPFSGDTLSLEKRDSNTLLVYAFHDQGLGFFKGLHKQFGLNITSGLPFKRLSVDHGTAFHLANKDIAINHGLQYLMHFVLKQVKN